MKWAVFMSFPPFPPALTYVDGEGRRAYLIPAFPYLPLLPVQQVRIAGGGKGGRKAKGWGLDARP